MTSPLRAVRYAALGVGLLVSGFTAERPSDSAPRGFASQPFAPRGFASRVAAVSGPEQGEPAEAAPSPTARDAVDIWPAAAPGLPQAVQLPDLVLPDYPVPSGSAGQPSGHAPIASASPDLS